MTFQRLLVLRVMYPVLPRCGNDLCVSRSNSFVFFPKKTIKNRWVKNIKGVIRRKGCSLVGDLATAAPPSRVRESSGYGTRPSDRRASGRRRNSAPTNRRWRPNFVNNCSHAALKLLRRVYYDDGASSPQPPEREDADKSRWGELIYAHFI